ncbi:unnamed protein product [Diabrotica balteata]|uniref:Uncharacterized protein n=1 Tax=Diabrotica balteata TaxID=107213 RepID=A0A9N9SQA1_DIABA|nr:unnamed protein product [Diabrotica balteata]
MCERVYIIEVESAYLKHIVRKLGILELIVIDFEVNALSKICGKILMSSLGDALRSSLVTQFKENIVDWDAAWKNLKTSAATEKEIQNGIMKYLKRPKERAYAELKIMQVLCRTGICVARSAIYETLAGDETDFIEQNIIGNYLLNGPEVKIRRQLPGGQLYWCRELQE